MSLRSDLENRDKFIITAELNPPKGTSLAKLMTNAKKIKDLVSAINITDNSGANMKMFSLAPSYLIQQELGVDSIWQVTCRDRNRLGIQSDLLSGVALGLRNLLPLRGDDPKTGDHPDCGQNYDLQTEELLQAIDSMKAGKDQAGNEIDISEVPFDYCVGSAAHPGVPDLAGQAETMKRRQGMGVEFFQTQICFENDQLDKFYEAIGEDLARKTIVGVTPIKSLGQAKFMNDNIYGVTVPEEFLKELEEAANSSEDKEESKKAQQQKGLELTKRFVDHLRTLPFKGIHLMAIGQESVLDQIIPTLVPEQAKI